VGEEDGVNRRHGQIAHHGLAPLVIREYLAYTRKEEFTTMASPIDTLRTMV